MARSVVVGAGALLLGSCEQMLGLEAPRLDTCGDGCLDGAVVVDLPPPDAATTSTSKEPDDGGPLPPAGADGGAPGNVPAPMASVRCGSGDLRCSGGSQTCCAQDRSSRFDFVCISQKASCSGTPVGCAKQSDCAAPFVCCDVLSTVACVTPGTCNGVVVCDPGAVPSECPSGLTCRASGDSAWPYHGCAP